MQTPILISALLLTGFLIASNVTAEPPPGMVKATFVVHCYDVGVSALSGKPGVFSVEPGWSGAREVDRVIYNPQLVSIVQLENWLKKSGTYISTLESTISTMSGKEASQ